MTKGHKASKTDKENGGDGRRREVRLDDGPCALICEQMRFVTDLQRVTEVAEGAKILMEAT